MRAKPLHRGGEEGLVLLGGLCFLPAARIGASVRPVFHCFTWQERRVCLLLEHRAAVEEQRNQSGTRPTSHSRTVASAAGGGDEDDWEALSTLPLRGELAGVRIRHGE